MSKAALYWSIGQVARFLGVSVITLRRWEKEGRLTSNHRTLGNHRRYKAAHIQQILSPDRKKKTVGYARVSSHDQQSDLDRQIDTLRRYDGEVRIISDLGSGLNGHKKGLKTLMAMIINQDVERLIIPHKDRLLRFGNELIFSLCHHFNGEVIVLNDQSSMDFETQLSHDVIELMTVFCARLYGSRSHKNKV